MRAPPASLVLLFTLGIIAAAPSTVAFAQEPEVEITDDEELDDALPDDDAPEDLKVEDEEEPAAPEPEVPVVDDEPEDVRVDDEDLKEEETDPDPPPVAEPPIPPVPSAPPVAKRPAPAPPLPRARTPKLDFPDIPKQAVITEQELLQHIESRANYVRLELHSEAAVELAYIEEARRAVGARNIAVVSASLIREAQTKMNAGLVDRALELAEASSRISPDLAAGHWMRAKIYWNQDKTQVARIGGALASALEVKLFRFRNMVSFLSNVAVLFGLAILCTILLFAVVQTLKYVRYAGHDFASIWPAFFGTGEAVILVLIVLGLPVAFGFGLLPSIAFAIAIAMAYQTKKERIVGAGMLILLGLSPGFLYFASPLVTYHGSLTDAMASAVADAFSGESESQLRTHLEKKRNDFAVAVILAQRHRQRGDLAQAEVEYKRALSANPRSSIARNNLGVVQLLQGRAKEATASFNQATGPKDIAEPFLNLASIVLDAAHFDKANKYLESARAIDPDMTLRYTRLDGGLPTAQKMMEARVGEGLLWGRLFDADPAESLEVSQELWAPVGGRTPPLAMPVVALLAGLLGFLLVRGSARLSIPCPRCGIPADRGSPAHFCAQCTSVFLTAVAVDPGVRAAKEDSVRKHQRGLRFFERILSVVAGAGHMYGQKPLFGAIVAFCFFLVLGAAVFPDGFVVNRWDIYIDGGAQRIATWLALGIGAVLALLSLRRSFS